jgi:CRISPR/Cas system-associated exonuclease Cas4 (RecB family)
MSVASILKKVIEDHFAENSSRTGDGLGYIRPSSLAWGCLLYVARELLKTPKPDFDPRVKRILDAGISGHYRIAKYFAEITVARELPFVDEEYRIRGQCDALLYIPPEMDSEKTGFYVVEIKTVNDIEYERLKQAGEPRDDHRLQCLIYLWGIERYYRVIPLRGGILYYENRNTLEYLLFAVEYDKARLAPLLERVKEMLRGLKEGRLPENQEPVEHCSYCAYLQICDVGQQAMRQKKQKRRGLPDVVLAKMIAEKIVKKQKLKSPSRRTQRSLEELTSQLGWREGR